MAMHTKRKDHKILQYGLMGNILTEGLRIDKVKIKDHA